MNRIVKRIVMGVVILLVFIGLVLFLIPGHVVRVAVQRGHPNW